MHTQKEEGRFKTPLDGINMKLRVHGEKTCLCEFHLAKGSAIPSHSHPHEQTGYMVSGKMNFTYGEESFLAVPGSSWNIPGGVAHGVEVLEDSIVVEVFSPVREDYLD